MDLLTLSECPTCGSSRGRDFFVGRTGMRRCTRCRLVYAREVAAPSEIYRDDYLTGGSEFGPDTTDPIVAAIGRRAAERRFEIIEGMAPIGTVLDVGCGSGEALDVARSRGWAGTGVEPVDASAARARARGLDVRTTTLAEANLAERSFDVVVAWHVVEHLLDPVGFLIELRRYARTDGLLAIEVPNWRHSSRRREGARWDQLCPLEHVTHFTPRTMRRAMRRAGLRPKVRTDTAVDPNRWVDGLGFGFAVLAVART